MKYFGHRTRRGFTLVELLVVIAIIGILAGLLLPVLAKMKEKTRVKLARLQVEEIAQAIQSYESIYPGKLPTSSDAVNAANSQSPAADFTFGTFGILTPPLPFTVVNGFIYEANNSEIIGVLMDWETFPNGQATINNGHLKNPQRTEFLKTAKLSGDDKSPGVGIDGVYRDPWGNPYIITLDLNYDEYARDAYYKSASVSANSLNGLIAKTVSGVIIYEANSPVMVWSAGSDKKIGDGTLGNSKANEGSNKDNIVSWK